jgi:alkylated DNA repair dioxygenase AlkB
MLDPTHTTTTPQCSDGDTPPPQVLMQRTGALVTYRPAFLQADAADALFETLMRSVSWHRDRYSFGGKPVDAPRLTAAFGDADLTYTYAGQKRPAQPWPDALLPVLEALQATLGEGTRFNYCLANLYDDGASYIGWHADAERDLSPGSPIASVSLGASRRFLVGSVMDGGRRKKTPTTVVAADLRHGSLLVMEGERMQRDYKHSVPKLSAKTSPSVGARINLTFRVVRKGGGKGPK